MKDIFRQFIIWRLLLFIPVFLAGLLLPFRANSEFTTLSNFGPWINFDGVHYLNIAMRGYIDEGRFLPLFPAIIKFFAIPFAKLFGNKGMGIAVLFSGNIISFFSTLLALYYLAKLLQLDYKKNQVKLTINFLLIFPTAFFLACVYSEGLFLLLSVLSLYSARQKKWLTASIFGMLLSITRLSGVLIILPLLWEFYELEIQQKNLKTSIFQSKKIIKIIKSVPQSFLWFIGIPIPLLLYAYFNFIRWGDFLYFIHAHANLGNSREVSQLVFPLITIIRYFKIFFSVSFYQYELWIAVLEFASLLYALWSLFLMWKEKIRTSYTLYSIALLSLPIFSGTFSGLPRYILPIFPFYIAQSLWFTQRLKSKHPNFISIIFIVLSIVLQAILLGLFARGYYVS